MGIIQNPPTAEAFSGLQKNTTDLYNAYANSADYGNNQSASYKAYMAARQQQYDANDAIQSNNALTTAKNGGFSNWETFTGQQPGQTLATMTGDTSFGGQTSAKGQAAAATYPKVVVGGTTPGTTAAQGVYKPTPGIINGAGTPTSGSPVTVGGATSPATTGSAQTQTTPATGSGGVVVGPGGVPNSPGSTGGGIINGGGSASYTSGTLGNPTPWLNSADQTVAGQMRNLTDPNNPNIQQARSRALGQMNERGLLNSSMAVTAADSAAYDAALPIAQADAANASKITGYNADQINQFGVKRYDTEAQVGMNATNNATSRENAQLNASTQKYINDQNNATSLTIKKLDQAQQAQLTDIGNKNQALLQNSSIASNAYGTYAQTLYNNSVNKDMTPQARYQADQNAFHLYQQQISIASQLLGVPDLSAQLIFTGVDPGNDPAPAVTPTDVFLDLAQAPGGL